MASFSSYCHFMENDNNLFDVQEVMAFSIVFYLCIIPSNRTVLEPKSVREGSLLGIRGFFIASSLF